MNFNNKMILGQPIYFEKSSGLFAINPGIMLLNLKKMRETNMEKKILNITIKKGEKYRFHDQSIINKYFKSYLGNSLLKIMQDHIMKVKLLNLTIKHLIYIILIIIYFHGNILQ